MQHNTIKYTVVASQDGGNRFIITGIVEYGDPNTVAPGLVPRSQGGVC